MYVIVIKHTGNFSKTYGFLERIKEIAKLGDLDKYGRQGVAALSAATPVDSGKTASSWYYTIDRKKEEISLNFHNSNVNDGIPIAIILNFGHATRNGGWVEGVEYIDPALQPVFNKIASDAWKEVDRA